MWAGDDLPAEYMYWIEREGVARETAIPPDTIIVNLDDEEDYSDEFSGESDSGVDSSSDSFSVLNL